MNGKRMPLNKQDCQQEASSGMPEIPWRSQDTRENLMMEKARTFGVSTALLIQRIWSRAAIQTYWDCQDVFRCARQYSPARLERAACQAIELGLGDVQTVRAILAERLDLIVGTNDKDSKDVQFLLPFMGKFLAFESSKRS